ncbi:hypothetical protein BESB_073150 [Besnoitia besnoiti]|uniref:Uncharacterized protein n=1 Tax=Besnoitia besnoiti TaxID=94643 RepID=A0A2A9MEQ9_BESBE|nr:uncharacterized protein BESB_073150 [Besnoitia besnoiti]PFH34163.1 hypothetical protein BESB_073150 [Besnoitia besnoiti]
MFGCQSPSASSRAASASSPSPASGETPWGSARRREPCASPKLPSLSPEPRPFKDGDDLETSDDATLAATSPRAAAREGKKDGKKSRASPASPPPAPSVAVQEKRRGAKKSASVASGKRQADSCAERAPASLGENGEEKQKQAPLSACPCCSEARGSSTAGISSASVSQDSASPSLSLALIDASLDEGLRLQAMRRQSLSPTTARLLRRGERAELNLRAFHVITTPTGLLPWTGGDEHEEDRFRGPEESSVRQEEGSKRRGGKRAKGEDAGADPDEGAQRRKAETATSGEDTRSSRLGDEESQEDVKGGRTQGCSRNDSTCEELETQDALERASGELTTPQEAETVPSAKGEGPGSGAGPHSASGTQATREGSCAEQDAARLQVATGDEQDVGKERTGNGVEQAPSSFPSSPLPSSLSSSPSPASPPASPCLCSSAAPDTMEEISFSLEALWQSFEDASVYGLEIPFLDAHDNLSYVVYIPYISALHLYPAASPPSPSLTPLLPEAQVPPLPPAAVSEQGTPVSSRGWSRTQVQGEPAAAASGAGGAKGSDSRKERKTGAEDARKNEAKKKESDPLPLSLPVEVRRTAPAGAPRPATAPSFKYMEVRLLYQRRPLYQQIERLLQGEEVMQSQLLNLLVAQSHELNQDISWLCIYWQAVQRDFSMTPAPSYLVYYRLRATREHRGERFTLRRFATVPSRLDLPFLIKNHAPLRASSFAGEDETVQKSPLASSVREIAEQRVKLAGKAASVERVSCEDEEASSRVDPARGPREGDRDEANGERREREEREEVDRAERAATEFTNKMENEVAKVTEWLRELRLNHPDFEHIKARGLGKLPPPSRGPGA